SVTKSRIIENTNVFDFELSAHEMSVIDQLNEDERTGPDPDNFDF
ncbi:aldo/keto reductase, partial [Bacillus altitudinis]|nr:aldo/keto reductase [Bacillus altitudinis]